MLNIFNDFLETLKSFEAKTVFNDVGVSRNADVLTISVPKEMTDDEYEDYIESIVDILSFMNSFIDDTVNKLSIEAKGRETVWYLYDNTQKTFLRDTKTLEDSKKTENKKTSKSDGIVDLDKKREQLNDQLKERTAKSDRPESSGTTFTMKYSKDEAPLAYKFKNKIQDSKQRLFDVDYAIKAMYDVYTNDDFVNFENEKESGIVVRIESLVKDFDGFENNADVIMNQEGNEISKFINICIFELGFSNVVPKLEFVASENGVADYKYIIFKCIF